MSIKQLESLITALKSGDIKGVRDRLQVQPQLVHARPDGAPSLPLLAVYHGHPEVATVLIQEGAQVNIFEAAAMGLLEHATALLDSDPERANAYNEDGFQPLGLASFFGHPHLARLLLKYGAEVNSASRNPQRVMPLHSAVAAPNIEIARLLLSSGANVEAVQQRGITPLHEAAATGHLEMLELLLQAGAKPEPQAEDNSTPLDLALRSGSERAAQILREAVAAEESAPQQAVERRLL